jgi:hypothetical protein
MVLTIAGGLICAVCRPPRGWRSWNLYGNNVNQTLITGIMDGMVKKQTFGGGKPTSLCDLGYCDVGLGARLHAPAAIRPTLAVRS